MIRRISSGHSTAIRRLCSDYSFTMRRLYIAAIWRRFSGHSPAIRRLFNSHVVAIRRLLSDYSVTIRRPLSGRAMTIRLFGGSRSASIQRSFGECLAAFRQLLNSHVQRQFGGHWVFILGRVSEISARNFPTIFRLLPFCRKKNFSTRFNSFVRFLWRFTAISAGIFQDFSTNFTTKIRVFFPGSGLEWLEKCRDARKQGIF